MPSSPKIKKEDILQTALEIVTQDGYAAVMDHNGKEQKKAQAQED